jgi:PAS domain S-box-containing protein
VKKGLYKSAFIIVTALLVIIFSRLEVLPYLQKIPSDFSYNANVFSVDNFYDETETRFSGEILSVTTFSYNTVKKDEDNDLIIKNRFEARRPSGKKIFSVERRYGIDPNTGSHVNGKGDRNRSGFLFAPQNIQSKEDFIYWHINYDAPALMKFQGEETIAGLKVNRYSACYKADQTKDLSFLKGVPKERGVEVDVLLQIWIDPVTGWLIKYEDYAIAWYYDIHTHHRLFPWNKFHNEFTQSSILKQVEVVKTKHQQIQWVKLYLPVIFVAVALIFLFFNRFKSKYKKELLPLITALLIFFTVSGLILWFYQSHNNLEQEKYLEEFEGTAGKTLSYVKSELEEGYSGLDILRYNYRATNGINRNHFSQLTHHLLIRSDNVLTFGYAPFVKNSEREAFELQARKEVNPDFQITERNKAGTLVTAGKRDFYLPIYFIEPVPGNERVLGFDILSDTSRQIALNIAKGTADMTATEPVSLVQVTDSDKLGIVIYNPIFKQDEAGQRKLSGYFSGVYLIENLITSAISSHDIDKDMTLKIFDVTSGRKQPVFSNRSSDLEKDLKITKRLPVLNRIWEFNFYHAPLMKDRSGIALLGVRILFAFILSVLVFIIMKSKTKELKESNERFFTIFDNNPVGMAITSLETDRLQFVNELFLRITGYSKEELIGKTFAEIHFIDPEARKEMLETLNQENELKNIELLIRKKNGEFFWALSSFQVLNINNHPFLLASFHDISERKKIENELKKSKQTAEEAVVLRETFLANMSHEIRTPMNAIIGFTDLLLKRNLPAQEKDFVQTIKNSGENLLRIINDILDISKINSGTMTFEEHPISILELFDSLNAMLSPKARSKNLSLQFQSDKKIPDTLLGDPTRLTQIILNLAGNAIKFTREGSVRVSANLLKEEGEVTYVEFIIKDTGIGIPAEKLKLIFERFSQAESHTTRTYGGTGLGLDIAKQLVLLQGGTINVKSTVDQGSEFTFVLPFKKTDRVLAYDHSARDESRIYELNKLAILLVEDNPINVKFVLSLFEDYNIRPTVAENGYQAIENVKRVDYDLILMDIEMPKMNGFKATEIIRHELKKDVPIIALTAHAMAGEEEKCLSMGMNGYISKPINATVLFEKMMNIALPKRQTTAMNVHKQLIHLDFLIESLNGKKNVIRETMNLFLEHVPADLSIINEAVKNRDFSTIKGSIHKLKSTISLIGIYDLIPIAEEMEMLGKAKENIERIALLNQSLNQLCERAIEEIRLEQKNYE